MRVGGVGSVCSAGLHDGSTRGVELEVAFGYRRTGRVAMVRERLSYAASRSSSVISGWIRQRQVRMRSQNTDNSTPTAACSRSGRASANSSTSTWGASFMRASACSTVISPAASWSAMSGWFSQNRTRRTMRFASGSATPAPSIRWRCGCQVAVGDVTIDGIELDQLGDSESSHAFGFGKERDGVPAGGTNVTNRTPPAPLVCRNLRQRHTENTTQGV